MKQKYYKVVNVTNSRYYSAMRSILSIAYLVEYYENKFVYTKIDCNGLCVFNNLISARDFMAANCDSDWSIFECEIDTIMDKHYNFLSDYGTWPLGTVHVRGVKLTNKVV